MFQESAPPDVLCRMTACKLQAQLRCRDAQSLRSANPYRLCPSRAGEPSSLPFIVNTSPP